MRDPAVNCWKNRFLTFPENGDGVKMVTKEEDYKGSLYIMVLVTKDFTEMRDNKPNLVANEEHYMEMLVISAQSV